MTPPPSHTGCDVHCWLTFQGIVPVPVGLEGVPRDGLLQEDLGSMPRPYCWMKVGTSMDLTPLPAVQQYSKRCG
jgi:hypothetical protein